MNQRVCANYLVKCESATNLNRFKHNVEIWPNGTKYSRMDQVKFAEDGLLKN